MTERLGTHVKGDARTVLAGEVVKRYVAGESIRALAKAHSRSYGFIYRILVENGVTLRRQGAPARKGAPVN